MNKINDELIDSFIESISVLTGINKDKLNEYSKEHNIYNIINNPKVLSLTKAQANKINQLSKFISSYKWLNKYNKENITRVSSPEVAADYLNSLYGAEKGIERFIMVLMDTKNKIIDTSVLSTGTIDCTNVYKRELVKKVLSYNASSVILCHNHPSGETRPSKEDKILTSSVSEALNTIGVQVLDHIIIGDDNYYSFLENDDLKDNKDQNRFVGENYQSFGEKSTIEHIKNNVEMIKEKNINENSNAVEHKNLSR